MTKSGKRVVDGEKQNPSPTANTKKGAMPFLAPLLIFLFYNHIITDNVRHVDRHLFFLFLNIIVYRHKLYLRDHSKRESQFKKF